MIGAWGLGWWAQDPISLRLALRGVRFGHERGVRVWSLEAAQLVYFARNLLIMMYTLMGNRAKARRGACVFESQQ